MTELVREDELSRKAARAPRIRLVYRGGKAEYSADDFFAASIGSGTIKL